MKRIAASAVATLVTLVPFAQGEAQSSRPKIVVGIVVDQLRTDYMEDLEAYFGEKGFRTLMGEGRYYRDVDFGFTPSDATVATASLYTGAWPAATGVAMSMPTDRENPSATPRPALAEEGTLLTNSSFTPEGLRLTTISDEVAVGGGGLGSVYSISTDPQQAVIMAGHAGSGAVWLNNTSGNWATTSYYGQLPPAVSARNMRQSVQSKADTMQWHPTQAAMNYIADRTGRKGVPFQYKFSRGDRDVYKKISASPLANAEVTDLAIDLIKDLSASSHPAPDMLSIGYTAAPYKYAPAGGGKIELADTYIRLDRQIGRLIEAIDRYYGKGNALIWLTSTGYYDDPLLEEKRFRLPGGEFSVKRARSLLNSYLSARHGSAGYVEAIRDRNVYFNHKAISDRGLKPAEVIADARDFLSKMSGISRVVSLGEVLAPSSEEMERMRRASDARLNGDLIIEYMPGWSVSEDEQYPPVTKTYRMSPAMTPAIIMGDGLQAERIDGAVDATALAPTVAGVLRIRSPNGARSRPLPTGTAAKR